MSAATQGRFPGRLPEVVTLGPDIDLDQEVLITPSGRRLANDYADELVARVTGRPSLTGPGERSPMLALRVPVATKRRLEQLAASRGRRQSDLVREALDGYLEAA